MVYAVPEYAGRDAGLTAVAVPVPTTLFGSLGFCGVVDCVVEGVDSVVFVESSIEIVDSVLSVVSEDEPSCCSVTIEF